MQIYQSRKKYHNEIKIFHLLGYHFFPLSPNRMKNQSFHAKIYHKDKFCSKHKTKISDPPELTFSPVRPVTLLSAVSLTWSSTCDVSTCRPWMCCGLSRRYICCRSEVEKIEHFSILIGCCLKPL